MVAREPHVRVCFIALAGTAILEKQITIVVHSPCLLLRVCHACLGSYVCQLYNREEMQHV